MESHNPATGEVIATYDLHDGAAVEATLSDAASAAEEWRERSLAEREARLEAVGEQLRADSHAFARTMSREMGKPITQAEAEVEKCAWACEHYAEFAGSYLQPERYPSPPGVSAKTVYEPLGPVLAVMPWNFPLWQVIRFAAPALTAGNVAILKHAPEVPDCATAITEVFSEAGYPSGVFQNLRVEPDVIHDTILPDDRVRAATLTGSGPAGSAVAETAGAHRKKTVLELGGTDPFIVLEDADVEAAAETGAWARILNTGQSCIAAKRMFVHEAVYDEFKEALLAEFESYEVGDPLEESTDVGPMVSQGHLETLAEQVRASVDAGATVLRGGEQLERDGAFFEPTLLEDAPAHCPASEEELFGPVAVLESVADADEAIRQANDTNYGLGASLWTEDRERGRRLADRIEAGCVFVNQLTKSDPRVPFGGIKDSGYGRELSAFGITEFTNRKTVWVE